MRIGTGAFYDSMSSTVARLQHELGDLSVMMSSGKKVRRPSDNPLAATIIAHAHMELSAAQARARVLTGGIRTARAADAAMGEIAAGLRSALDTAMRVLQPGRTPEDLLSSAAEIRSSIQATLTAANAKHGDRYLFGGYQDRLMPFEEGIAGVGYLGDSGQLTVPVSAGRTCDITVPGDKLLNFVNDEGERAVLGVDGDVFSVLRDLAEAVENGDMERTRILLDETRLLHSHVMQMRGSAGASEVRMQTNLNALEDAELRYYEILAQEESIDVAQAVSEYVALETSYQAVLGVLSRIIAMPTVFDLTR